MKTPKSSPKNAMQLELIRARTYLKKNLIGACKEIRALNRLGVWPKRAPVYRTFCRDYAQSLPDTERRQLFLNETYRNAMESVILTNFRQRHEDD